MAKRQTSTFSKSGITNSTDAVAAILVDMDDSDFSNYIQSILDKATVTFSWDDSTNTCTIIRDWHNDSDYNLYITNWGTNRNETNQRLKSAGWTTTESVVNL